MAGLVALAAATLLAQPGERAPPARVAAGPVEVEAETVAYDEARDRFDLAGGVTLRSGKVVLRAERARYSARTGEVDAFGRAFLVEPGRAVSGDGIHAVLGGPFQAEDVVAFFKEQPLDLTAARSEEELRLRGPNRYVLAGERVRGDADGRLEAEGARLTLCDCGTGPPSWEVRSTHGDVIPGKRAILLFPVFYATPRFLGIHKPVPVLPLPWLYLPLGDRQTGLLLPEIRNSATGGWGVSLPLFLALGRSYDATITADYVFGIGEAEEKQRRGVRGPGATLELRWTPAEGTAGQLRLFELHDLASSWAVDTQGKLVSQGHGDRTALTLRHDERFSPSTHLLAEVGLVNDANYVFDFAPDVLLRSAEYSRSAVALTHRTDDVVLEADASYHLQLANLGQQDFPFDPTVPVPPSGARVPRVPYGPFGSQVPVFHRLPSASATLLPVQLAGPVRLSGLASLARFTPIHGVTGDEGAGGIGPGDRGFPSYPSDPRDPASQVVTRGAAGQSDGAWEPGERLAATRLALRAELRAPVALGRHLELEPWIRGSANGYAFEAAKPAQLDAWASAGLTASTRLSRTFGAGTAQLRHFFEPRVEWAWGGLEAGPPLPAYAYDELDAPRSFPASAVYPADVSRWAGIPVRSLSAIPPGGFHQLRLALRNRLVVPAGPLSRTEVELELGQDFDLAAGRRSETWARGGFGIGPLSGSVLARFFAFGAAPPDVPAPPLRSPLDAFTELRADLRLGDARGDDLHAGLIAIGSGASPASKAGLDDLFDARPIALDALAQGSVGGRARLSGLQVAYDAYFNPRTIYAPSCTGDRGIIAWAPHIQQHAVSAVWDSPCHCWKLGVVAAIGDCRDRPDFRLVFDLSRLGSRGFGP